jgi:hypothetical protein
MHCSIDSVYSVPRPCLVRVGGTRPEIAPVPVVLFTRRCFLRVKLFIQCYQACTCFRASTAPRASSQRQYQRPSASSWASWPTPFRPSISGCRWGATAHCQSHCRIASVTPSLSTQSVCVWHKTAHLSLSVGGLHCSVLPPTLAAGPPSAQPTPPQFALAFVLAPSLPRLLLAQNFPSFYFPTFAQLDFPSPHHSTPHQQPSPRRASIEPQRNNNNSPRSDSRTTLL